MDILFDLTKNNILNKKEKILGTEEHKSEGKFE